MKFGFIGAGNMAAAIVKGMTIGTESYDGKDIFITSKTVTSAQKLADLCGAVAVSSAAEEIFVRGGDREEIYRAAHSYVVVNTDYDDALAERSLGETHFSEADLVSRSAYGALCQGKSVCSGYAQAFQALCRAVELPCWTVYGTVAGEGTEREEHVWNAVLVDGEVYYVDCTFDDGLHSRDYFLFTEKDPQYSKYQVYSGWIMPW